MVKTDEEVEALLEKMKAERLHLIEKSIIDIKHSIFKLELKVDNIMSMKDKTEELKPINQPSPKKCIECETVLVFGKFGSSGEETHEMGKCPNPDCPFYTLHY